MESLKLYDVAFSGLTPGLHEFEFHLDDSFFDLFDFEQEFRHPDIHIRLEMERGNTFLELSFTLNGKAEVTCDLTNEPYDEELSGESALTVKFGEDYDLTDDETWVIPFGEHKINVAQILYEMALLSIPMKKIHPDVKSGKSESELLELLEKYSPGERSDKESKEEATDPRWDKLKELKVSDKE